MTPDPAAVPAGWQAVRLGDVCAPPAYGANASARPFDPELPRYVRITDITDGGRLRTDDPRSAEPAKVKGYELHAGDLLFARSGSVGRTYLYRPEDGSCVFAGYLIRFRPDPEIALPRFVELYTHSSSYHRWVASILRVGAQPNINAAEYRSLPILLPPLAEQRAIAAVLDAIDEAIERTEEVIAATEHLRDALLHELLTRGLPGRHSEWADVPGLGTVPVCWEVTTVGRCLERIEAGSSPRCESRPARGDEWGVLKVSSVSWGVFKPAENKALLEPSDIEPRYEVKDGDLILSRANTPDLVGRAVLVRVPPTRLLLSDKTLRLVPDPARIVREFLLSSLRLPRSRSQIAGAATGSSRSMFNVSQDNIRKVRVALPPLGEQQAIAAALDGVDGATERAREERARLHSLQASAADALLTGRVRVAGATEEAT